MGAQYNRLSRRIEVELVDSFRPAVADDSQLLPSILDFVIELINHETLRKVYVVAPREMRDAMERLEGGRRKVSG